MTMPRPEIASLIFSEISVRASWISLRNRVVDWLTRSENSSGTDRPLLGIAIGAPQPRPRPPAASGPPATVDGLPVRSPAAPTPRLIAEPPEDFSAPPVAGCETPARPLRPCAAVDPPEGPGV